MPGCGFPAEGLGLGLWIEDFWVGVLSPWLKEVVSGCRLDLQVGSVG